ncbi:DUF1963 domain-containing protein [bacterium]|nr:DUF1963 domain-containing protein [bacterium]
MKNKVAEVIKSLTLKLEPFKRKCWIPVVDNSDGSLVSSKFSGKPFLRQDEAWPLCGICHNPMLLALQLNICELPEKIKTRMGGQGLLQLFYCTDSCGTEDGWEAFSKNQRLRIIMPDKGKNEVIIPNIYEYTDYPPKVVKGWKELDDYPHSEELSALGVFFSEEEERIACLSSCNPEELEAGTEASKKRLENIKQDIQEPGIIINDLKTLQFLTSPKRGDKLWGWPSWSQGIEYSLCPICNKRMSFIFQLNSSGSYLTDIWSDSNLPNLFADGNGHILQCEDHRDQIAFPWAC